MIFLASWRPCKPKRKTREDTEAHIQRSAYRRPDGRVPLYEYSRLLPWSTQRAGRSIGSVFSVRDGHLRQLTFANLTYPLDADAACDQWTPTARRDTKSLEGSTPAATPRASTPTCRTYPCGDLPDGRHRALPQARDLGRAGHRRDVPRGRLPPGGSRTSPSSSGGVPIVLSTGKCSPCDRIAAC